MAAPTALLQERIERVQQALKEGPNAPMLVTDPANVGWLTGIPEDFQKDARMLIGPDKAVFVTDGRYENRIPEVPGMDRYIWGTKHMHQYPELKELLEGAKKLVVDTRGLPIDIYERLPQMLDVEEVVAPPGFLDRLRMVKGITELELIREAVKIQIGAFRYMVDEWLPANRTSKTDMDFMEQLVEKGMELGAEGVSFEPLVAMDQDADTPHPDMTRAPRPLKDGTVMLVDWGFTYKGVCTDTTRMIVMGADELPAIFQGMRLLQEKWFQAVEDELLPGKKASDGGNAYVVGMKAAGIDKPFHGAGHGTGGAYVHELPKVSGLAEGLEDYGIPFGQAIVLEPGMIVTNEPGMYEKGVGAYRTENMVLITEGGREILDKDLPLEPFFVK
ncbi:Xaa-Pro peptidase family protein [bacterium]|nr:Xaa-Pro peptidase family protein [bacterium]